MLTPTLKKNREAAELSRTGLKILALLITLHFLTHPTTLKREESMGMDADRILSYLQVACAGLGFDIGEVWWMNRKRPKHEKHSTANET